MKYFYYVIIIESRAEVGAGLKKLGSLIRSVTQKRNQGLVSVTAWKRAVKIIKFVTVTVAPLFCKLGNRKSYQIRDLGPWFWQIIGPILRIPDYQYKRYINLDQNCRLYQLDTKKMMRMISNCPVKKSNINLNTGRVYAAY